MLSTNDYARLALTIVATDRSLGRALATACRKTRPAKPTLVLLEAALRDALAATTVTTEEADAARLTRQARPR